jgi:hypothetical protein
VGWQVKIYSWNLEGPGTLQWTSPIQKSLANSSSAASGFTSISHAVNGGYAVPMKIILYFYKPGSKTNWSGSGGGRVVLDPDWFDYKWNGNVQYQDFGCHEVS